MSGCEMIKCVFYKDGKCTDEAEFVSRYTSEPMCRHNEDAVPWDNGDNDSNLRNAAPEMYEVLLRIKTLLDEKWSGYYGTVYPLIENVLAKAEGREVR